MAQLAARLDHPTALHPTQTLNPTWNEEIVVGFNVTSEDELEGVHLIMHFLDEDYGVLNPDDPIGVIQLSMKEILHQQHENGGKGRVTEVRDCTGVWKCGSREEGIPLSNPAVPLVLTHTHTRTHTSFPPRVPLRRDPRAVRGDTRDVYGQRRDRRTESV